MESYGGIDRDFIDCLSDELGLTPGDEPQGPTGTRTPVGDLKVDLSACSFVTLFDMLQLFLIVDHCQAIGNRVSVLLPGVTPESRVMKIDEFNQLRLHGAYAVAHPTQQRAFIKAKPAYEFIAFLNHFGFFSCLQRARVARRVMFPHISESMWDSLRTYSGAGSLGSRILPLKPIRDTGDAQDFLTQRAIRQWLRELPSGIAAHPVFRDGEFARVLGYQLVTNILEHAGSEFRGEYGSLGAIAMRILPANRKRWVSAVFPNQMPAAFSDSDSEGTLEICVGDRGRGITNSLKTALSVVLTRIGCKRSQQKDEIVYFAFDELGSSKAPEKRWGGVHALHRILSLTAKYRGILRLRTASREFVYDASSDEKFGRPASNLGFLPTRSCNTRIPLGVQLQILLPLLVPRSRPTVIIRRGDRPQKPAARAADVPKVISVSAYFHGITGDPREDALLARKLTTLANSLMVEPTGRPLAFDFGGRDWREEEVAFFLHSQKSVLHTHTCLGIDLSHDLAHSLREREATDPASLEQARGETPSLDPILRSTPRTFFEVLSTRHRLFPVRDTSDELCWFGLGRHRLDTCLDMLFRAGGPEPFKEILATAEIDGQSAESDVLNLYLCSNVDLFKYSSEQGLDSWACLLGREVFDLAVEQSVRTRLLYVMNSLGCRHGDGRLYKLPSRPGFTKMLITTAPLLQNEVAGEQIGAWIASAVRQFVDIACREILLVTATAPAFLLATVIANSLPEMRVHLLDLGHIFALDQEGLVHSKDWSIPVIAVADIVDTGRTVHAMRELLASRGISPLGVVALLKFGSVGTPDEMTRAVFTDNVPVPPREHAKSDASLDQPLRGFFLAEIGRPKGESDADAMKWGEDNLFLVEPYSLEPFRYSSLAGRRTGYHGAAVEKAAARLHLLEEVGALRTGHWVFGSHHFLATVAVGRMLNDDSIAGDMCAELVDICSTQKINYIVLPLHSNISRLLPRFQTACKLRLGQYIPHTFALSTMSIAKRPFYVLPEQMIVMIGSCAEALKVDSKNAERLRVLILDDAVATGRTVETLLRALVLEVRRAMRKHRPTECPVDSVHVYAIVDRQGRARSTLWSGIRRIGLTEKDEWASPDGGGEPQFSVTFGHWLHVDMPVEDKRSCELCQELHDLQAILGSGLLPKDHSALESIRSRAESIGLRSTEIPAFGTAGQHELPRPVRLGHLENVSTCELALWEFHNLVYRGCPFSVLIEYFEELSKLIGLASEESEQDVIRLVTECGRIILRNWEGVATQWATDRWLSAIRPHIETGSPIVDNLLSEAGRALALSELVDPNGLGPRGLKEVFRLAVHSIAALSEDQDPALSRRENLGYGCILFCLYYRHFLNRYRPPGTDDAGALLPTEFVKSIEESRDIAGISDFSQDMLLQVWRTTRLVTSQDTFVPALLLVLDQTARPARRVHEHLLPAQLRLLLKTPTSLDRPHVTAIRNALAEFAHCLELVKRRLPRLLATEISDSVDVVVYCLERLVSELSRDWRGTEVSERVRRLACDLLRIFPAQRYTPIFDCLTSMCCSLKPLLEEIGRDCNQRGILFNVMHRRINLGCVNVLVPRRDSLEAILRNYIVRAGAERDADYCESPEVLLDIQMVAGTDGIRRVALKVYTNFAPPSEAYRRLATGQAQAEFGTRDLPLFGVRQRDIKKSPNDAPNGKVYSICVCIDLVMAFATAREDS